MKTVLEEKGVAAGNVTEDRFRGWADSYITASVNNAVEAMNASMGCLLGQMAEMKAVLNRVHFDPQSVMAEPNSNAEPQDTLVEGAEEEPNTNPLCSGDMTTIRRGPDSQYKGFATFAWGDPMVPKLLPKDFVIGKNVGYRDHFYLYVFGMPSFKIAPFRMIFGARDLEKKAMKCKLSDLCCFGDELILCYTERTGNAVELPETYDQVLRAEEEIGGYWFDLYRQGREHMTRKYNLNRLHSVGWAMRLMRGSKEYKGKRKKRRVEYDEQNKRKQSKSAGGAKD